jgi:hypothetical protein
MDDDSVGTPANSATSVERAVPSEHQVRRFVESYRSGISLSRRATEFDEVLVVCAPGCDYPNCCGVRLVDRDVAAADGLPFVEIPAGGVDMEVVDA